MVGLIIGISLIFILAVIGWVNSIDNMKTEHPDYKGEDFLNWDDTDHNDIF